MAWLDALARHGAARPSDRGRRPGRGELSLYRPHRVHRSGDRRQADRRPRRAMLAEDYRNLYAARRAGTGGLVQAARLELHRQPHRPARLRGAGACPSGHDGRGPGPRRRPPMSWLPLSFGLPAVLWGLLALPVIWWLLRLTPPRPQTESLSAAADPGAGAEARGDAAAEPVVADAAAPGDGGARHPGAGRADLQPARKAAHGGRGPGARRRQWLGERARLEAPRRHRRTADRRCRRHRPARSCSPSPPKSRMPRSAPSMPQAALDRLRAAEPRPVPTDRRAVYARVAGALATPARRQRRHPRRRAGRRRRPGRPSRRCSAQSPANVAVGRARPPRRHRPDGGRQRGGRLCADRHPRAGDPAPAAGDAPAPSTTRAAASPTPR